MNEKEFFNNREYICAYCLNKNEDKLCDDYSNDCNKVNVLRNDYSDYLEDCITELLDDGRYNFSDRQNGMTQEDRRSLDSNFKTLGEIISQLIKNQKYLKERIEKDDR